MTSNDNMSNPSSNGYEKLNSEIENLKDHLLEHKKDNHSRRGILLKVAKRRKLLSYLKSKKPESYAAILEKLNLRK